MEDEREPKKKRLLLACNVCRRKKIKCDGVKPTCGKCQKFNQECSYSSNIRKRGPRQGHIELLEQRLKKMEELMTASNNSASSAFQALQQQEQQEQQQSPTAGYTVINAHAPPSLEYKPRQPNLPMIQQTYHSLYSSGDLPSLDIMQHLIDLFFKHCGSICSIVDVKRFRQSVVNKTCNPFLLYSVLAVAARFSDRSDIIESPLWMSGEKYASKARAMLDQVIEKPSIDNCQGILILNMNEYGCARGPRCWTYTGLAIRMIIELGLHKEKIFEEGMNSLIPLERWYWYETRRKLFWDAFIHDKFASASTGRPSVLNTLDCDVLLPVDYNVLELEEGKNDFYQSNLDQTQLVHYHIVRDTSLSRDNEIKGIHYNLLDVNAATSKLYFNKLGWTSRILQETAILDKVTQLVNRGYQQNNTSAYARYEENSEFEKIDLVLDQWIENLPLQLRNTPANLELYRNITSSAMMIKPAQYVLAHMMHNALIVLLNRPSLVIADMPGLGQVSRSVLDKVHRSMEKCLAAADNVTVMLKDLVCKIEVVPPFVAYLVYTTATVLVNNSFSMNPQEAQKAELALKEYFRFLSEMKVYWAMADKLYFMIRDLYAVHKKVLHTIEKSNQSGLSVSSNSTTSAASIWNTTSTTSTVNESSCSPSLPPLQQHQPQQPFISPYPQAGLNTIPARRLSIAEISLSTSDYTVNRNRNNDSDNNNSGGGFFSFHNNTSGIRNTSRPPLPLPSPSSTTNIFDNTTLHGAAAAVQHAYATTAPNNNSFTFNSFDMWLQQQQQSQGQQQQQRRS